MADYDCEWCEKTETCKFAYQSTDCEQDKYDKVAKIPKEKQEEIATFKYDLLKLLREYDLEDEDFYYQILQGFNNLQYYMREPENE
jgi:hypothetical protein